MTTNHRHLVLVRLTRYLELVKGLLHIADDYKMDGVVLECYMVQAWRDEMWECAWEVKPTCFGSGFWSCLVHASNRKPRSRD